MNKSLILLEKSYDTELRNSFSRGKIVGRILIFLVIAFTLSTAVKALGELASFIILAAISGIIGYFNFKIEYQSQAEVIERRRKGFIRIKDNQLEIKYNNRLIPIEKNQSFEFRYFSYHGETEGKAGHHVGTRNYVKFNNDIADTFFIYIPNSKSIEIYNEIVNWCLDNGMQVKEFNKGERVHGGKKLKYKELQEFKKKYKQA